MFQLESSDDLEGKLVMFLILVPIYKALEESNQRGENKINNP